MLLFVLRVWIHSEKREEFLQTIRLLGNGMANPKGCLSHDWYQSMEDPNRFILFERWADGVAMKQHHRSEQFRVLLGAVRTLGGLVDVHSLPLPKGGERAHDQPADSVVRRL